MSRQRQKHRYGLRDLKDDLGALAGLLAFLAVILGIVVLPGFMSESASTLGHTMAQEACR
jgi:hypothetical protein